MEEFLKENEKDFLDYINFKKKQEEEIKRINNDINKIKSEIIVNNLGIGNKPYLEIEQKKLRIEQIKEKITNLGIGREVNRIKKASQSDKDVADFNVTVEIERLKKEQKELETEITEIINACKNSIETKDAQEKINCMQKTRKTIEQRITDRRNLLEEMINRKIELREEVLLKISEKMKKTISEMEINIKEKEKSLINVTKIEFGDEDSEYLYELKQKTLARLKEELEQMKSKLYEEKNNFSNIYSSNKSELDELKKLKEDLNSNDLSKLENDLGIQQEEKNNEEIKEDSQEKLKINDKNNEDEVIMDRRYIYDSNGNVSDLRYVPCRRNKKTGELEEIKQKSIFLQKTYSIFNNIKNKIKSIFNKEQENSNEINENNSKLSLAERLHYEIENPEILDGKDIEDKNKDNVVEK